MTLGQLFAYEDMPALIANWDLLPVEVSGVAAASLAILQVLALPALLAMPLRASVRRLSSISGWIVLIVWACIALGLLISGQAGVNSGIFGSHINVPAGLWMIGFTSVLIALRVMISVEFRKR